MAYNPLRHYIFDDDSRRGSLTGLTGFLSSKPPRLVGMEFIWEQGISCLMGSCDGERVDFEIDGPGGEYIDAVGVNPPEVPAVYTIIKVSYPSFLDH